MWCKDEVAIWQTRTGKKMKPNRLSLYVLQEELEGEDEEA
jgi:hypothetical protein